MRFTLVLEGESFPELETFHGLLRPMVVPDIPTAIDVLKRATIRYGELENGSSLDDLDAILADWNSKYR